MHQAHILTHVYIYVFIIFRPYFLESVASFYFTLAGVLKSTVAIENNKNTQILFLNIVFSPYFTLGREDNIM